RRALVRVARQHRQERADGQPAAAERAGAKAQRRSDADLLARPGRTCVVSEWSVRVVISPCDGDQTTPSPRAFAASTTISGSDRISGIPCTRNANSVGV